MANTFFEITLPNGDTLKLIAITGENRKPLLQIQVSDMVDVGIIELTTKQVKQLRNGLGEYLHDDICSTNDIKTSIEDCKPQP